MLKFPLSTPLGLVLAEPAGAHPGAHLHPHMAAPFVVAMLTVSALGVLTWLIVRHRH